MSEPRLSAHEKDVLGFVLDQIIPGAAAAGVAEYVEEALRPTPEMLAMITRAVAAADALARARGAKDLVALDGAARAEILAQVEASADSFPPVLLQTYAGYYQQPSVLAALGLESRPPHPAGYAMPANDLTLLEPVLKRGKFYRE